MALRLLLRAPKQGGPLPAGLPALAEPAGCLLHHDSLLASDPAFCSPAAGCDARQLSSRSLPALSHAARPPAPLLCLRAFGGVARGFAAQGAGAAAPSLDLDAPQRREERKQMRQMMTDMQALLRRGQPERALEAFDLEAASQGRAPETWHVFDTALKAAAALGDAAAARRIHAAMAAGGQAIGYVATGSLLAAICRGESPQAGLAFLLESVPPKSALTPHFNAVLAAAAAAGDAAAYERCLGAMAERGKAWDARTWGILLRAEAEKGDRAGLEAQWQRCQAALGSGEGAEAELVSAQCGHAAALASLGDIAAGVTALRVALSSWQRLPRAACHQARRSGLDKQLLHAAHQLVHRASERDVRAVAGLPRELQQAGLRLHPRLYNSLLAMGARGGLPSRELRRLLADMAAAGEQPSAFSYGPLLWALRQEGDLPGAQAAVREMREAGIAPDVYCYAQLLRTLRECGWCVEAAADAYAAMRREGRRPSEWVFAQLFQGVASMSAPPQAEEDALAGVTTPEAGVTDPEAGVRTPEAGVTAPEAERHKQLLAQEQAKHLLALWAADATAMGLLPRNSQLLLFHLQALGSTGQLQELEQALVAAGPAAFGGPGRTDARVCNAAIAEAARWGDAPLALRILGMLDAAGVPRTVYTYTALINAYAMARAAAMARQTFDEMRRAGLAPAQATYAALVKAECMGGCLDAAVALADRAAAEGAPPSPRALRSLATTARLQGRGDVLAAVRDKESGAQQTLAELVSAHGGAAPAPAAAGFGEDSDDDNMLGF